MMSCVALGVDQRNSSACRLSYCTSLLWQLTSVSTQGTRQQHDTQASLWQSMLEMCLPMQRQGGLGRGVSSHAMPQHCKPNGLVREAFKGFLWCPRLRSGLGMSQFELPDESCSPSVG